jgi:hypothetical protein
MRPFLFLKLGLFRLTISTAVGRSFCSAKRNQKRLLHFTALRVPCDARFNPKLRNSASLGRFGQCSLLTDESCASRRFQVTIKKTGLRDGTRVPVELAECRVIYWG